MQCLAVDKLPESPAWQYEVKFGGYRALGIKAPAGCRYYRVGLTIFKH
jgi:ATP-dependent DNA ligase